MVLPVLALVSGLSFLRYGFRILFRVELSEEFARYGVPRVRAFVGVMELLGGAAVLVGIVVAPLGALGAGGLTLLMIIGLGIRIKIHDPPRLMVPAAVLAALNAVLVVLFLSS